MPPNLLRLPRNNSTFQYQCIAKQYPHGLTIFDYGKRNEKRYAGLEPAENTPQTAQNGYNDHSERNIRRSKTIISDIVLCNSFDSFATFTFKHERDNIEKCKSKMSNWLHSQQKKHGKFQYLIVPEFHKDGKSIHFHALPKNYTGNVKQTHLIKNKRPIYNITSYRSGYSTLVYIDDIQKVSSYIKKYITKDMPRLDNKKRFWTSKDLKRPLLLYDVLPDENDTLITTKPLFSMYFRPLMLH